MHRPEAPAGKGESQDAYGVMTPEIAAEAAVWVARLHGPERSSHMERECLAWQARSEAHRVAFERCTDTWQDIARVTLRDFVTAAARPAEPENRPWPARRLHWALGVALAGLAAGAGGACLRTAHAES